MQSENKADAGSKDKNMNKWELLQNFIICVHTWTITSITEKNCSPNNFLGHAFSGTLQITIQR